MHDVLQSEWLLGLLWRASWQSIALAMIVATVIFLARHQIAPRWRVILWSLPLLRLVLLVLPTSSLSLFNLVEPQVVAPLARSLSVSASIQDLQPQLPSGSFTSRLPDSVDGTRQAVSTDGVGVARQSVEQETVRFGSEDAAVTTAVTNSGTKVLLWIWISGLSIGLIRYLSTRIQLANVLARATLLDRQDIAEHLISRTQSLGIRRRITCWVVEDEVGPASTGLLRPRILFPQSLLSELSERQVKAILDHEIHHVCRFDCCYLLLCQLACCLHWFNPLVYWMSARVRAEIEYAVDSATVGQIDELARKSYGDLLITLASRRPRSFGLAPMAGRRSNLKLRIEELLAPVRSSKWRSACCLVVVLLLITTGLSEVASTQEDTGPKTATSTQEEPSVAEAESNDKNKREFELLIVDTDGQAIPEARVEVRGKPKVSTDMIVEGKFVKHGSYGTFLKPTKDGRIRVVQPPNSAWRFSIKADGYGPYWAEWKRVASPDAFTAVLDLGRIVGGVVVDENGKPIAGAEVKPFVKFKKRPGDASSLGVGTRIKTDEQGRWSFKNLPREHDFLAVEITHPQFKPLRKNLSAETFELKPGQLATRTTVMNKGLSVTGKIVDADGNSVEGALIRTKLFNEIRSTKSDGDGAYELTGCQDGVARIVVSAPGLAVDMRQVHIEEAMDAVDFTMQPGGHVRLRVVDEKGDPVPKARVFFQEWRERSYDYFEFDHVNQYADQNGIWEWNEAPTDEFKADICRPGGMALGEQSLNARAEEYIFVCPPKLVVVGRVIDAETRQPIESFQVVPGVRSSPQHMNWVPHEIFEAKGGAFEYSETHDYFAHLFKIQAQGYLPVESRDIKSNEGRVDVTFELKRGADIDMRVETPEGFPAEGAKVALGIPGAQISVENGDIDDGSTYAQRTEVNAAGKFQFPRQSTAYQLIITHESGFAHFKSEQSGDKDLVRLTPWSTAEGTFRVAKKPVGGVELYLNSGDVHSYGDDVPSIFTSCKSVTRQDGRFRFERVFPGSGRIARSILRIVDEGAKEVTSSTSFATEFLSNQTTRVDFGLVGCPVIGKLVKPESNEDRVMWSFACIDVEPLLDSDPGPAPIPEELKNQPDKVQDWYNRWEKTDSGITWSAAMMKAQRARLVSTRYSASCDTQGRFQIDDMPAGTYKLSARFHDSPRVGGFRDYVFTVPEANENSGEQFDLGPLQLLSGDPN